MIESILAFFKKLLTLLSNLWTYVKTIRLRRMSDDLS